ncbi:YbaL family putative K(+) efflux transporter [Nitrosovibrio sp. Nv17]|uniref:YbaL family putative K(+) efflux transporter n=1 Tax=Nitrosovibrio sp. Nv17 TaxID=1855339 RepID=UPI0009091862|nr:YbaL family putative K(+) efflux transporter [Nitrosovibrio sp. Nv17]SFW35385.1 Kef-type potassium/proton antiporter, CPA2 family [Nitrosovibrio sp. Nv17]
MPHSVTLITTIAVSLGLALLLGLLANRFKLPVLVGYLVAGVILGSNTPGFVADMELSAQLAEIGVILLMFGVGLHFSLNDLLAVRRIALPGAIVQIGVATALGAAVATAWGWDPGAAIVFGVALSTASTVVLLRALEQRGVLKSVNGSIAVGWLVVEDLAMVMVLVLLPPLAGWLDAPAESAAHPIGAEWLMPLLITFGKVAIFIALMLIVGKRVFPWLLWHVASTHSTELFILSVIAVAIGIAYGSAMLFGVSFALGAFFAGMVMRESDLSHRAAQESLPLRDAFSVLFFVSVGMLFDPNVFIDQPFAVIATLAIIIIGKSLAAFLLVLAFRYPLNTALTVSASLAQIGEFSFILAALGVSLGLLPVEAQSLILAGAFISITLNPLVFRIIEPAQEWIRSRSRVARVLERSGDPLAELPGSVASSYVTSHVVLVGYGRVGRHIGETLTGQGLALVVVDQNREMVEGLRRHGIHAVAGDAADPAVLIQAHIARARVLVIAVPDTLRSRRMIEIAHMLNPSVEVTVRAHNEEEAGLLSRESGSTVFLGERELALSMTRHVLQVCGTYETTGAQTRGVGHG